VPGTVEIAPEHEVGTSAAVPTPCSLRPLTPPDGFQGQRIGVASERRASGLSMD
jgi:hypothetical protein